MIRLLLCPTFQHRHLRTGISESAQDSSKRAFIDDCFSK
jgi:hypothetical protein